MCKETTFALVFCIIVIVFTFSYAMEVLNDDIKDLERKLLECKVPTAEVINGNLWVGYEDGVRVGFHEFNGTWYRNGMELVPVPSVSRPGDRG